MMKRSLALLAGVCLLGGAARAEPSAEQKAEAKKDQIEQKAEEKKENIDQKAAKAKKRADKKADEAEKKSDMNGDGDRRRVVGQPGDNTGPIDETKDAWVTTKVKAKLFGEDLLDGSDVSVDTENKGVVTLSGTVASEAAKKRAVDLTKDVEGVRDVKDELKVLKKNVR